jgi:tRNA1(Val) A37 N6-methylase TrmN6
MRNVARIKLGYYPLPDAEAHHLRSLLVFPEENASVIDPCVGTGRALHLITESGNVEKHGVELDANRAEAAQASGIQTIYGNLFNTSCKVGSFSLLYLNPPYDSEIATLNNKRMEYLFLDYTSHWLVEGGILVMVVPQKRVEPCISILAHDFSNLEVLRLTDPESERFDQVVVIGVRKTIRGKSYETNRAEFQKKLYHPRMPELRGSSLQYLVPPSKAATLTGLETDRGLPAPPERTGRRSADYAAACRTRCIALHGRASERRVRERHRAAHCSMDIGEDRDDVHSRGREVHRNAQARSNRQ